MMGFGFIWMVFFWLIVIGAAVLLARGLFEPGSQVQNLNKEPQSAREILDERYARGEITREQYRQIKEDLR